GVYLQFDGRQGREAVIERDAQRMIGAVEAAYAPDSLDLRSYRKVEPVAIATHQAGISMIVRRVQFGTDTVRLELAPMANAGASDDVVTWVTVKWPIPLSKSFSEADVVDGILRQFLAPRDAQGSIE